MILVSGSTGEIGPSSSDDEDEEEASEALLSVLIETRIFLPLFVLVNFLFFVEVLFPSPSPLSGRMALEEVILLPLDELFLLFFPLL